MSLIYGKNTVANALAHNDGVQRVWIGTSFKDDRIFRLLKEKKIPFQAVSSEELGRMAHRAVHQGIVAEVKEYAYLSLNEIIEKNKDDDRALLVLLDGIEDPHNLGAIVRTSTLSAETASSSARTVRSKLRRRWRKSAPGRSNTSMSVRQSIFIRRCFASKRRDIGSFPATEKRNAITATSITGRKSC